MNGQKALFFDIDGTLLNEKTGKVPTSAVQALTAAKAAGHLVFINTGRAISTVPDELKQPFISGFVCGCGTYISYGEEVLLQSEIPHERGREIIRIIQEADGEMIAEGHNGCYFPGRKSRFEEVEWARTYFGKQGIGLGASLEDDDFEFGKFCFHMDEETDKTAILNNLVDMDVIDHGNRFYEAMPKGYSKASGIAFVLNHFGIDLDDTYVFGDSSNDLPMFEYVPHAIAMEKHHAVLDPYTEYVTKKVEEDGILLAMEKYGII